jgi:hypothetical protein
MNVLESDAHMECHTFLNDCVVGSVYSQSIFFKQKSDTKTKV